MCRQCAGSFKFQHDTGKNLKFLHVFPLATQPHGSSSGGEVRILYIYITGNIYYYRYILLPILYMSWPLESARDSWSFLSLSRSLSLALSLSLSSLPGYLVWTELLGRWSCTKHGSCVFGIDSVRVFRALFFPLDFSFGGKFSHLLVFLGRRRPVCLSSPAPKRRFARWRNKKCQRGFKRGKIPCPPPPSPLSFPSLHSFVVVLRQ